MSELHSKLVEVPGRHNTQGGILNLFRCYVPSANSALVNPLTARLNISCRALSARHSKIPTINRDVQWVDRYPDME
jgi:hypothetical protein